MPTDKPLNHHTSIPIILTIAGSDSAGGAGIQADIKAISATGGFACSAITAITAQNTLGVHDIFALPKQHIESQIDAVFSDLNVVAVKVGMLADSDITQLVAKKLQYYQPKYIVVDPVMVATSGDVLLQNEAIETLTFELLPMAHLSTPNLAEAALLTHTKMAKNKQEMHETLAALRALGLKNVLLKGGHLEQDLDSYDLLSYENDEGQLVEVPYSEKRIQTANTHGTGCSLSSAIASYLAQGYSLAEAVKYGKGYVTKAILHADELDVGAGHGPVHHFYNYNSTN